MAPMVRLAVLALALALSATLVAPVVAVRYYHSDQRYDVPNCAADPDTIYISVAATEAACLAAQEPCSEGSDLKFRLITCLRVEDDADPVPRLPNMETAYLAEVFYGAGVNCTGAFIYGNYYAINTCFMAGTFYFPFYAFISVDEGLTTVTKRSDCDDHTCAVENCGWTDTYPLNVCHESLSIGVEYEQVVYIPPTAPTVFTAPYQIESPQAVTVPVSPNRDCYARVDDNIFGGWTVSYNNEQVCCIVRGHYHDGLSYTGCRYTPWPLGFLYTSLSITYQACYGSPELDSSLQTVDDELVALVADSVELIGADADTFARSYAVVADGQREGAYALSVFADGHPRTVYCIGRGVLMDGGARCRVNPCDDATTHFVAGAGATSDGNVCFHTCYWPQF